MHRQRTHRAFTLVELIAVIIVLAVLSAVALPKLFDWSDDARDSADAASISGIRTALSMAFQRHRLDDAPAGAWIDGVDDIAAVMETGALPSGLVINGAQLQDQRGNKYDLTAETATAPALLTKASGGWS